jgi:hypothetical protein
MGAKVRKKYRFTLIHPNSIPNTLIINPRYMMAQKATKSGKRTMKAKAAKVQHINECVNM